MIARFPVGALQFEVGIQTFDTEVQQRISRRQDNDKTSANVKLAGQPQPRPFTYLTLFWSPR